MNRPTETMVDHDSHLPEIRNASLSCDMASWLRWCCILALPIDVFVFMAARLLLGYEGSRAFLGFWIYAFPVLGGLIAIGSASFFASWTNVPRLLTFVGVVASVSALNLPVYSALYLFSNLGPM